MLKKKSLLFFSCLIATKCSGQGVFFVVNPLEGVEITIKDANIKGFTSKPDLFTQRHEYNLYQQHAIPLIGESITARKRAISTHIKSLILELQENNFFEIKIPEQIPNQVELILRKQGRQYIFKSKNGTIALPLSPTTFKGSAFNVPTLGFKKLEPAKQPSKAG